MADGCGFKALGQVTDVIAEDCSGFRARRGLSKTLIFKHKQLHNKTGRTKSGVVGRTDPSTGQDRGKKIASSQPSKANFLFSFHEKNQVIKCNYFVFYVNAKILPG